MSERTQKYVFYRKVVAPWVKAGGRCFKCKNTSDILHCHHILTRASAPSLLLCPENLVPLCDGCHRFAHEELPAFREFLESIKVDLYASLRQREMLWSGRWFGDIKEFYETPPEWEVHWMAA